VTPLESRIDELYQGSLADFIAARTALAKTLKGAEAQRVKRLQKPLLVPWVVNQVYWHARPVYQRLSQSGETLRAAQVAALSGRNTDVQGATRAHRQALAAAVDEGMRYASRAGARPAGDQLARTLEALSLASKHPETPGRLTKPLNPAGFEALGGVAVKAAASTPTAIGASQARQAASREAAARARERQSAAGARERQAAVERQRQAALEKAQAAAMRKAEADVERARSAEVFARKKWEQAKELLTTTERALKSLRSR